MLALCRTSRPAARLRLARITAGAHRDVAPARLGDFPTLRVVAHRAHSSDTSASRADPPPEPSGSELVDSVNHALHRYPMTTALVYLYHNAFYAGCAFGALWLLGIDAPSELGLAFALNSLTRRLRMPIIAAAAAGVVKLKPQYGKLQLSKLMMAPFASLKQIAESGGSADAGGQAPGTAPSPSMLGRLGRWAVGEQPQQQPVKPVATPTVAATDAAGAARPGAASELSDVTPFQRRIAQGVIGGVNLLNMGGLLDRYGLAYILCGRAIASANIIGVACALRYGVDVDGLIAQYSGVAAAAVQPYWEPVQAAWSSLPLVGGGTAPVAEVDAEGGTAAAAGAGVATLAAGWMSRWAVGCLAINAAYPFVLRVGVAGVAERLGPLADRLSAWLKEAEAAEAAGQQAAAQSLLPRAQPSAPQQASG